MKRDSSVSPTAAQNHAAEAQDKRGRRDVLRQCDRCHVVATARVTNGRATFESIRVVDGQAEVVRQAENRWREAEHQSSLTNDPADRQAAQTALYVLRDARRLPSVEVHDGCGGQLRAFDIKAPR